jgi:MinD-like ATPase involved in chromosome partitioning or flagellar assembly
MGNVIAFVPTSGGVGSSTLAAAVAVRAAAAGRAVVAVDLDPLAGCLDVVFGLEQEPGWRWPELADVAGVVDGLGLADELPVSCGVPVLSGRRDARWDPRSASGSGLASDSRSDSTSDSTSDGWLDTLPDVVAGLADAHDLTVLDLPRDPAVLDAVALLIDALVVVVGTQVPQLAAASAVVSGTRGLLRRLRDAGRPWEAEPLLPIEPWVVLRGRRVEADLEDLVMDDLDVPLVATIGDDRRLIAEVAEGLPPGARGRGDVVRAADELLLRLTDQAVAA